jgi:hypothetical protein
MEKFFPAIFIFLDLSKTSHTPNAKPLFIGEYNYTMICG